MKTPTTFLKGIAVLIFMTLALSACNNKSDDNNRAAGRSAGGDSQAVAADAAADAAAKNCADANKAVGKVYEIQNPYNFEAQVKAFISATLDPKLLGEIGGTLTSETGVDLKAAFKFDKSGNLIADQSSMKLIIFDSFVDSIIKDENGESVVVQPYEVAFSKATEGFYEQSTGNLQVVFSDSYGSITFRGRSNGEVVSGTIEFNNRVAVAGYSAAVGKLGDFLSYSCAMIQQQ